MYTDTHTRTHTHAHTHTPIHYTIYLALRIIIRTYRHTQILLLLDCSCPPLNGDDILRGGSLTLTCQIITSPSSRTPAQ